MANIIFSPGIIPASLYEDAFRKNNVNAFVILDDGALPIQKQDFMIDIKKITQLGKIQGLKHSKYVEENYNRVYESVLDDHLTMEIDERSKYRKVAWKNNFNSSIKISNIIVNTLDLLKDIEPEFVFFQATPHSIYNWVLARTAELVGIPVFYARTSALPWRSVLVRGVKECDIIPLTDWIHEEEQIYSYLAENRCNYDEAIPSYERKRLEARKGKFWSWKKEISNCFKKRGLSLKVFELFTLFRKYSLYKYYQDKSSELKSEKYVIVFLHYQPERTSLPEGLYFTQQYNLIRTLRLGLPDDIAIYVKEHPSMFINDLDIRYRNKDFYDSVSKIENTYWVDIRKDSFTLLDNSLCIATITGTVGVQSLIRGKGVLSFGNATYKNAPGCYRIKNAEDVRSAIDDIMKNGEKLLCETSLKDYFTKVMYSSVTGVDSTKVEDPYKQEYRLKAEGKILSYLIESIGQ